MVSKMDYAQGTEILWKKCMQCCVSLRLGVSHFVLFVSSMLTMPICLVI